MHAPGHVRRSFLDLLEGGEVPGEELFDNEAAREQWDRMENEGQLQSLAGWLWYCSDSMPNSYCEDLDLPWGSTYADAAQLVRQQ